MTPNSSIPVALLYNERLLEHLLSRHLDGGGSGSVDDKELEERYKYYARREFQLAFQHQDNEIFNSRWTHFCENHFWNARSGPVLAALGAICDEFIEERYSEVHIKLERYGEWQNVMANINYEPIAAYAAQSKRNYDDCVAPYRPGMETHVLNVNRLKQSIPLYPLCYPHEIVVEDYIRDQGLNDAHLHINACAFAEFSWLYALKNPRHAYRNFLRNGITPGLRQQFLEIYQKDARAIMLKHLRIARNLRVLLRNHVAHAPTYHKHRYRSSALSFINDGCSPCTKLNTLDSYTFTPHFKDTNWNRDDYNIIILRERLWLSLLIRDLKSRDHWDAKAWLLPLLHVYLLLMNEFCNLFTQKESQKGFDQFLSTQRLRNAYAWRKNYYFELFKQFHGSERDSIVHYLDARIAAKISSEDNSEQLRLILLAYVRYLLWVKKLNGETVTLERSLGPHNHPNFLLDTIHKLSKGVSSRYLHLNLTAHFLKKPWTWKPCSRARYQDFRRELYQCCRALRRTMKVYPRINTLLRGVDATCDEQYVPPAVFAPCFRYCRKTLGMESITFHCGEDFAHLLTGIRVMNDAMNFLDLRSGDRLGHGTALGIDPKRWRKRVPETLYVKREDRMLDLLFALDILQLNPEAPPENIRQMRNELLRLSHELFDSPSLPAFDLVTLAEAMKLRQLSPNILRCLLGMDHRLYDRKLASIRGMTSDDIRLHKSYIADYRDEFIHTVNTLKETPAAALPFIMAWFHEESIWQRGQQLIRVEVKKEHSILYRILQRHLMEEFRSRRIVIETLITSNLRIARYKDPAEHHSMRWLLKRPDVFREEPNVLLAFGTDDPGIFFCDAKSEFYMLYASLHRNGVTEKDAIALLRDVNERGRSYSFLNTNTHTHS